MEFETVRASFFEKTKDHAAVERCTVFYSRQLHLSRSLVAPILTQNVRCTQIKVLQHNVTRKVILHVESSEYRLRTN